MLKKEKLLLFLVAITIASTSHSQNCGFKPYPQFGCKIGQCVNGKWEQIWGESNITSDSESINSMTANPKVADIAGALDARQRRLDAKKSTEQQTTISTRGNTRSSQLLDFANLRKNDNDSAVAIMAGIGQGFLTANGMLEMKSIPPLYCQPKNLILGVQNYMQIYDSMLERHGEKISNLESATVAQILIVGLIETFPCEDSP